MKKSYLVLVPIIISLLYSQSVEIKDGADQLLLQINDEGDSESSITIPSSGTTFTPKDDKLYNDGGTLKWNGSALSTSSGDNFGDHTATQNIDMAGYEINLNGGFLSGDGDEEGIYIANTGNVGFGGNTGPWSEITVGPWSGNSATMIFARDDYTDGRVIWGSSGKTEGPGIGGFFSSNGNMGIGVLGRAYDNTGINYGVRGRADSPSGWAGYFEGRGYFSSNVGIGETTPNAKLEVNGDIILGENGTRFLEIQEITGTTGVSNAVTITDALPVGWTGTTTRVLSFEIQYGSATGNWVTSGNDFVNTEPSISASLYPDSRTVILYYPALTAYQNQAFRMILMRMP